MSEEYPAILHHKHSLEDGHVAQQILQVDGYRGIMVTKKKDENRDKNPFDTILTLKALQKQPELLKEHGIVGFHIHHGSLAPKFDFLKKKYGIPMFVSIRGNDATAIPLNSKSKRRQLKETLRTADMVFPVCSYLKNKIIRWGCPPEKIRVLYGGVNLDRFKYQPRQYNSGKQLRFLAIGRFVEKKGFSKLIRAFAIVKSQYRNAMLTLVGKGPLEKEYRKLIKTLGLGKSVKIIPWADYQSIQKIYYRSHIFCAPSCTDKKGNKEGIPNTLKEAMATGMPVISTKHAGIPELVKHKVNGLLVRENAVLELASAMKWLVRHPNSWEKLGSNARKKIEEDFNLPVQLMKQKQYYDEALHAKKSQ